MSKKRIKELDQKISGLTKERNELESDLNIWCPSCKKGTKAKDMALFKMRYAVHCYDGTDWETSDDVEYVCRHCDEVIIIRRYGKCGPIHKLATTYCKTNLIYEGWDNDWNSMSVADKKEQFREALAKEKEKISNE